MATPARKFFGFAVVNSTRLKVQRSGDAWILKVKPQPEPQVKPAVPLPLGFMEVMVNVLPVVVVSPHPVLWLVEVALVATPLVFSVTVTSEEPIPHPPMT